MRRVDRDCRSRTLRRRRSPGRPTPERVWNSAAVAPGPAPPGCASPPRRRARRPRRRPGSVRAGPPWLPGTPPAHRHGRTARPARPPPTARYRSAARRRAPWRGDSGRSGSGSGRTGPSRPQGTFSGQRPVWSMNTESTNTEATNTEATNTEAINAEAMNTDSHRLQGTSPGRTIGHSPSAAPPTHRNSGARPWDTGGEPGDHDLCRRVLASRRIVPG